MVSPVAIVTGSSKRIGRAIALRLHHEGYCVVLHCRNNLLAAEALREDLNAARADSAVVCVSDLSIEGQESLSARCEEIIDCSFRAFGRCDVLVNNASSYYPTPFLQKDETNSEDTQIDARVSAIFGSNSIAPLLLTMAFARRQESGSRNLCVVNLCDSMVYQPLLGFVAYTMAKYALHGLTKAAAVELAPFGIRVNGVAPGLNVLPLGIPESEQDELRKKVPLDQREGSPEEIAEVVAFIVSEKATYITGSIISVDGGWSLTRK